MRHEKSQSMKVLRHLQSGKTISSFEAYEQFGITRLNAIMWILKNDGYAIRSKCVDNADGRTNYKQYWLDMEGATA